MPNVVMLDCGDYWHIVADYSGSPRHSALSPAAWAVEYVSHPAYATMRASMPDAIAATTQRGAGKWLKDFSAPWRPPQKT